jgi:NAD+ kinase
LPVGLVAIRSAKVHAYLTIGTGILPPLLDSNLPDKDLRASGRMGGEGKLTVAADMKRVLVLGNQVEVIRRLVREAGLEDVSEDPQVILTYGGDGLLLGSEREWPGVPKLPLRNSRHGKKCEPHQIEEALERLIRGDLRRRTYFKIRAEALGQVRMALNDVLVHNSRPTSGVRYRVWIDDREFSDEIVGDGVVVATPFGSTGYYRSITRGIFRVGIGLAFNNSTEQMDHMVLGEDSVVRVRITRGPAMLAADNRPDPIPLDDDDEVTIRRAEESAVLLSLS